MAVCRKCNWESIQCVTKGAAEVLGKLHGQENPYHVTVLNEAPDGGTTPKKANREKL